MVRIKGLNHVGIAVIDLDEVTRMFSTKFALRISDRIESKDQGILVALADVGSTTLELMQPLNRDGTVAKFLEKQGRNAIHHIAFSLDEELLVAAKEFKGLGIDMIYPSPRLGVMGHQINFCHPKFTSNILIELCGSEQDTEKTKFPEAR